MKQKIGIGTKKPKKDCNDKNCPFHGNLRCRGRIFKGVILSTKMHKSAIVEWNRIQYVPKFERYEKKRTRIKVHNPLCINAKEGDLVRISQCKPLSKTKNFVVIEVIGKEKGFKERVEGLEEAKFKEKKEEKEIIDEVKVDESTKSES